MTGSRHIHLRNAPAAIVMVIGLLSSPGGGAIAQQVGHAAWCVDLGNLGGYLDCNYRTYEQCAVAARGVTNVCVVNSFYVAKPPQRQRRDPRR
jgi:hypothetical protein